MIAKVARQLISGSRHLIADRLSPERRKSIGAMLRKIEAIPLWKQLQTRYQEHSADAFLISFPKCGRTWLRLMLGRTFVCHFNLEHPNLLQKMLELDELAELHPGVPKIIVSHDDDPQWKKSDELVKFKTKYKHNKVILLVRDPRDVVVSSYFEHKKRVKPYIQYLQQEEHLQQYKGRIKPYQGELSSYLHEEVGSLDTLLEFYNIWAANTEIPQGFLLVRYEDLSAAPHQELQRVLEFLGLKSVGDDVISEAVEYASFGNMRRMEREEKFNSFLLKPTDKQDEESYKTRKGKVGGFKEYLNQEDIAYLNCKINDNLAQLYGYK